MLGSVHPISAPQKRRRSLAAAPVGRLTSESHVLLATASGGGGSSSSREVRRGALVNTLACKVIYSGSSFPLGLYLGFTLL